MKLFLSDLDGTLLTKEKIISPATMQALKDYVNRGNRFAICTGRALESALTVKSTLGLDFPGLLIASYNGGLLYDVDEKKVIQRIGLSFSLCKEIDKIASEQGVHIHTYSDTHILAKTQDQELDFYTRVIKTPVTLNPNCFSELEMEPSKIIAIELEDHDKLENFKQTLKKKYPNELSLVYSHPNYLEVIPKESGKDSAVRNLSKYLGIQLADTIAAGDEMNDLSMIKAASLGVAMCNGVEAVISAADYVTKTDNNHDGLVPVFQLA